MSLFLQEVCKEKWQNLKIELMNQDDPKTIIIRSIIDMGLRYRLKHKIYQCSRNGHSFLVVTGATTAVQYLPLHIHWPEEEFTEAEVISLLRTLPNWDWRNPFFVFADPLARQDRIRQLLQNDQLVGNSRETLHQLSCEGVYVLRSKINDLPPISLSKGFKFGKLHPFQVSWIFSHWGFTFSEDVEGFKDIVDTLPTIGVYRETDDEYHHLPVSWIVQYPYGLIGMTYTLPEYRRLGLSKAATMKLIRTILEAKQQVILMVQISNQVSINYHVNLGFEKVVETSSFTLLPKGASVENHPGEEQN